MHISALLKQNSFIHKRFCEENRIGGHVSGVLFTLRAGRYVTDNLSEYEVSVLQHHDSIELETFSAPPSLLVNDEVELDAEDQEIEVQVKRKPGRPPGNKR